MIFLIFATSFAFLVLFIWYLASTDPRIRRVTATWTILLAIATSILSIVPPQEKIKLGLDLRGGTSYLVALQGDKVSSQNVGQAIEVIRKRMDSMGGREIIIQPVGENRISVQIPGNSAEEREADKRALERVAKLEFLLLHPQSDGLAAQAVANGEQLPPEYAFDWQLIPLVQEDDEGNERRSFIVAHRPKPNEIAAGHGAKYLSGRFVTRAFRSIGNMGAPEVIVNLDGAGAGYMSELSGPNIGQRMAIVLDGEARSAPVIRARLGSTVVISGGRMSATEAEELASVLENPLENPVKIESIREVDPSLGADSIASGWKAGLIAFLGVVFFMMFYYRIAGVVAVIAIFINLLILLGLLAQFNFTLTLPGIAGIILTIGMAVDANVLIYERIRDELAKGQNIGNAVHLGFGRAFSAIIDSNITTLIAAVVLGIMGTGPLRGFAVTLTLGIVANLFTALVVSRNCFDWMLYWKWLKGLTMMQLLTEQKINFLGWRFIGVIASSVIILVGCFNLYNKGDAALGVDFTGGDAVMVKYTGEPPEVGEIRQRLEAEGVVVSLLQYSQEERMLSLQTREGEGPTAEGIVMESFPAAAFTHQSLESIGPRVGNELRERAIVALGLGLLGILVYASLRFEWSFAVAATIGQVHDVIITIAMMGLLGIELTLPLVAALLAIAGYSINDKIVIFDRVREAQALREKDTFYQMINRGLNRCLSRSVLTTVTTLIAVVALMIFGGSVIHSFSVAMCVGVISGIYSSHLISPPVAYWLNAYKDRQRRKRGIKSEDEEDAAAEGKPSTAS